MPAIAQFLSWGRTPAKFLERCNERYGDTFTVRFPGSPPVVFFSHPQAIRDVLMGDNDQFRGGEAHAQLGALLDLQNSLIIADGEIHLERRRLMRPRFHGEHVQAYCHLIREVTRRHISAWPTRTRFPLLPSLQRISLDIILRAVLGIQDVSALRCLSEQLTRLISIVAGPTAILLLIPWLRRDCGPFSPWGRAVRLTREIKALLRLEIDRCRRQRGYGRTDVLAMLAETHDESGRCLTDREIADELLTLLVAGHETTATALAWVCYHILSRPTVQHAVVHELSHAVPDGITASEDVGRLEYLDAVIKETARLSPVITEVSRLLRSPATIDGRDIPAGIVATPCIYLAHRRPDVWQKPCDFLPERFLGHRPNPFAFFPFGGGTRRCLGAAFAEYEMKIVLAEIFSRLRLALAPSHEPRAVRRSITLAPSNGVPAIIDARRTQ